MRRFQGKMDLTLMGAGKGLEQYGTGIIEINRVDRN